MIEIILLPIVGFLACAYCIYKDNDTLTWKKVFEKSNRPKNERDLY